MRASSVWLLLPPYVALIAFASLFPFTGWRVQGLTPLDILSAPLPPQYWTWFDVNTNIAGYVPLGLLLGIGLLHGLRPLSALLLTTLLASLLSLGMESLQLLLPHRVPSSLDWALNTLGACMGAGLALTLKHLGALRRWSVWREHWFRARTHGGLALLALWPCALLSPAALPFGLGQVLHRVEHIVQGWISTTSHAATALAWLPARPPLQAAALQTAALSPLGEAVCVALGLLAPCLLGGMIVARAWHRLALVLPLMCAGVMVTALSCALAWGPQHTWTWLDAPARVGIILALCAAPILATLPSRVCALALLLGLMLQLHFLHLAPASAYFDQTLQSWEQGRFIRFYGLGQWLGWIWPYAALCYAALYLTRRPVQ